MTTLLQQAFDAAAKPPPDEQDLLASRVLAELAAEDAFDHALAASGSKLPKREVAALAEYDTEQTLPLAINRRAGSVSDGRGESIRR